MFKNLTNAVFLSLLLFLGVTQNTESLEAKKSYKKKKNKKNKKNKNKSQNKRSKNKKSRKIQRRNKKLKTLSSSSSSPIIPTPVPVQQVSPKASDQNLAPVKDENKKPEEKNEDKPEEKKDISVQADEKDIGAEDAKIAEEKWNKKRDELNTHAQNLLKNRQEAIEFFRTKQNKANLNPNSTEKLERLLNNDSSLVESMEKNIEEIQSLKNEGKISKEKLFELQEKVIEVFSSLVIINGNGLNNEEYENLTNTMLGITAEPKRGELTQKVQDTRNKMHKIISFLEEVSFEEIENLIKKINFKENNKNLKDYINNILLSTSTIENFQNLLKKYNEDAIHANKAIKIALNLKDYGILRVYEVNRNRFRFISAQLNKKLTEMRNENVFRHADIKNAWDKKRKENELNQVPANIKLNESITNLISEIHENRIEFFDLRGQWNQ